MPATAPDATPDAEGAAVEARRIPGASEGRAKPEAKRRPRAESEPPGSLARAAAVEGLRVRMAEAGRRIALLLGGDGVAYAGSGGAFVGAADVGSDSVLQEGSGGAFVGPNGAFGLAPGPAFGEPEGPSRSAPEVGDDELRARGQRLTETGLLLERPRPPCEPGDEPRPLDRELGEFVASLGAPAGGRRGRRAQRATMGKQASP